MTHAFKERIRPVVEAYVAGRGIDGPLQDGNTVYKHIYTVYKSVY